MKMNSQPTIDACSAALHAGVYLIQESIAGESVDIASGSPEGPEGSSPPVIWRAVVGLPSYGQTEPLPENACHLWL